MIIDAQAERPTQSLLSSLLHQQIMKRLLYYLEQYCFVMKIEQQLGEILYIPHGYKAFYYVHSTSTSTSDRTSTSSTHSVGSSISIQQSICH
jgi:hypothetical protein